MLVVGGGAVALRKATGLRRRPVPRSPSYRPTSSTGSTRSTVSIVIRRRYQSTDLDGVWLVVAATDDPAVQQQIFDDCERAGVFVNSADDPDRCSFILPAVVRRGPVIVAVSTQGRSPALAAQLRDRLADSLPDDLEQLTDDVPAAPPPTSTSAASPPKT